MNAPQSIVDQAFELVRTPHPNSIKNLEKEKTFRSERMEDRKEAFLQSLSKCWPDISKACKTVGVTRQAAFLWRSQDEAFHTLWLNIQDKVLDKLESHVVTTCMKPGMVGYAFPVLKAYRRSIYGDQVEHSGTIGTINLVANVTRPMNEHGLDKAKEVQALPAPAEEGA